MSPAQKFQPCCEFWQEQHAPLAHTINSPIMSSGLFYTVILEKSIHHVRRVRIIFFIILLKN